MKTIYNYIDSINEKLSVSNDIKDLYKKFNKEYFNDMLPNIEIKINNKLKNRAGQYNSKNNIDPGYIDLGPLILNSKNIKDVEETLAHEMIHVYQDYVLNLNPRIDWHEITFTKKLKEINAKGNLNISNKFDLLGRAEERSTKNYDVLFFIASKNMLIEINPKDLDTWIDVAKEMKLYSSYGIKEVYHIKTNLQTMIVFPKQRPPKKYYSYNREIRYKIPGAFSTILKDGTDLWNIWKDSAEDIITKLDI